MKHHDNLQYTRYLDSVFCSTVPLHITCHAEVTQRRLCVRLSHTTDKICVRHVAQIPNEYSQWHARKDSDFPHCCLCRFMCRVHTLTAISTFSLWIHHNSQTTSIAPGNCRRLRPKVRHILRTERPTKFKLGIQMEYEDPYHRQAPWPPKSNSKVARSRDASDSCWPISRELNVRKTPKLVERLPTNLRVIMRTGFKVKGQLGRLMLRPKVYYIFQTERLTNFKIGMLMEHALSTATASYERLWSWVLARGRGNTVSTAHGGHATCYVYTHVYCTVNKLRTHCIKFKSIRWRKINFFKQNIQYSQQSKKKF